MEIVTNLDPDFLDASLKAYEAIAKAPRSDALAYLNRLPRDDREKLERYEAILKVLGYFVDRFESVTADALEYVCKAQGWTVGMALQITMMINAGYLTRARDGTLSIGPLSLPRS